MPSIATGANAANKDLHYIGVSGDGDSLSIGFGQFAHAIRRNVNMLYICENNGVYGLTKGQFSASADIGTQVQERRREPAGAGRSVPGGALARRHVHRAQLLRRPRAARAADQGGPDAQGLRDDRRDLAVRDVQRPRRLDQELRVHARALRRSRAHGLHPAAPGNHRLLCARARPCRCRCTTAASSLLRKLDKDYDPTHRGKAFEYLRTKLREGEHVTGLIFLSQAPIRTCTRWLQTSDAAVEPAALRKDAPGRRWAGEHPQALRLTGRGRTVPALPRVTARHAT